jgi:hypothetical protein
MLLKVLSFNFCYDKKEKTRETVPGLTNTNQWWKAKKSEILAIIATFIKFLSSYHSRICI